MKETLNIKNMVCINCETSIKNSLESLDGVVTVKSSYKYGTVMVEYNHEILTRECIITAITDLDYEIVEEKHARNMSKEDVTLEQGKDKYIRLAYILIIMVGIYTIFRQLGLTELFQYVPIVNESMGYGMLFIVGLLTSLHCIGMCGGINIAQTVKPTNGTRSGDSYNIKGNLYYNIGRVISYTLIGAIVGGVGSVLSIDGPLKGIVALIAGGFMVIMGINMLGIFPWLRRFNIHMPRVFAKLIWKLKSHINSEDSKASEGRAIGRNKELSSYYMGLLNGLMPCGPLQSMQLFALSTGSVMVGATSMFFFSLGTVPLMFCFGTLITKLNKSFTKYMVSVSSVLVIILGFGMFNNGLALSGVVIPSIFNKSDHAIVSMMNGDIQIVTTDLDYGTYPMIEVKKDIPVVWKIYASKEKLNGCNNEIIINQFGVTVKLKEGMNEITFTPTTEGEYGYSCWMGMIRSTVRVVS